MFDQIASQLATEPSALAPASPPDLGSKDLLAQIVSRLEQEVPPGPYVPDKWLAQVLGISQKTLINRRGNKHKRDQYPQPLHLAGGQGGVHVRRDLIDWIAREELRARTRRVHKCQ
ncbi:hypothetical protein HHL11_30085 [Ramlibacter sp. G-1-2-2]|uniref:Uncharacterized protein n=1 Tax=Ramlibacter agri TaxID=2728837 RepID=A0A848HAH6_9BURK|nr:hypothetical protein [Ramlibacter agri]NML48036.1 hypothetical protein [Ramlibacter agri]